MVLQNGTKIVEFVNLSATTGESESQRQWKEIHTYLNEAALLEGPWFNMASRSLMECDSR